MDTITTNSYEELKRIYNKYFSLNFLGYDISNKFALISLTCYLTNILKAKKPDITHWSVLYKINSKGNTHIPDDLLMGLSIICSDFAYGCTEFPTFGIEDKKIPEKIKEILNSWIPF